MIRIKRQQNTIKAEIALETCGMTLRKINITNFIKLSKDGQTWELFILLFGEGLGPLLKPESIPIRALHVWVSIPMGTL